MTKKIFTNIVEEKQMREVQTRTLNILRDALKKSFGPYGSNTTITKINPDGQSLGRVAYTKDGHNILSSISFQDVIESSVVDIIQDITRNIVLKVGDGTTSAVILSSIIFDKLTKLESDMTPYVITKEFQEAVELIKEDILLQSQEFTPETAYKIAYVSTNGNEDVSRTIKDIYAKNGNGVYIDVTTSPNEKSMLKTYDGMTLETGYSDTAYINTSDGKSSLRNPKIYIFNDPIDTPMMGAFMDAIINTNVMKPLAEGIIEDIKPTVIIAPKISRDFGSYMESIASKMQQVENVATRPPLLIISNVYQQDECHDLAQLCGCKVIRKYIDPKQYEEDVENGLAPNTENVHEYFGEAELVESDAVKTKIINPKFMYKEGTTEYTDKFNNLVSFLEAELKDVEDSNTDNLLRYKLKRRIQSLKSNLVEYLVGGITASDRDSIKDLVEDAVKSCRNAAEYGVGYGANFEGLRSSNKLSMSDDKSSVMCDIIYTAYRETILTLYEVSGLDKETRISTLYKSLNEDKPFDIRKGEYNEEVLSSIMSDITILDVISKVMTLMITTNQFLCPDFMFNKYMIE